MIPAHVSATQRLGPLGGRIFGVGMLVGLAGLAASLLLAAVIEEGWDRFHRSYLMAFMFVLSLALGGLFFTLVQHATRAGWSIVIRRVAEAFAANLAWMWLLFIPVVLSLWFSDQYHWVHPDDALLEHKAPYLNVGFWLTRAVLFLVVWAALGLFYFRSSVAQDESGDVALTHRLQRLAPLGLLLYAVTQTYAAVDWIKSLEAHWFSTMFGVYFFAATTCGFFAAQILVVYFLQRRGRLEEEITLEHYQDMGKQLFAFGTVFWAYIAFSQFMLIWYGNIPEETTWYMARVVGGWQPVSWLLLVGHFMIPFVLLVTKHTKRIKPVLAGIAAWMLFMHLVDVYWLVMPRVPEQVGEAATLGQLVDGLAASDVGYHPGPLDLTCLVALAGFFAAGTARWLGGCALIPIQDPRLHESLAFENM